MNPPVHHKSTHPHFEIPCLFQVLSFHPLPRCHLLHRWRHRSLSSGPNCSVIVQSRIHFDSGTFWQSGTFWSKTGTLWLGHFDYGAYWLWEVLTMGRFDRIPASVIRHYLSLYQNSPSYNSNHHYNNKGWATADGICSSGVGAGLRCPSAFV